MKVLTRLLVAMVVVVLGVPALAQAQAGWITSCQVVKSLPDDPIVFPNQPGASHLHDFYGGRAVDAFATVATMAAGGTSCLTTGDNSGYWHPAIYEDGVKVGPGTSKHALFYYRRGNVGSGTTIQPFPTDLRFIAGDANAATPAQATLLQNGNLFYKCGPGGGTHLRQPPTNCSGVMVVSIILPQCWDGLRTDSPDHKAHMAYPSGGRCPSTHPVALPRIQAYFRTAASGAIGNITLASGGYWTFHADFWNVWNEPRLADLTTRCINGGVNCGTNPR